MIFIFYDLIGVGIRSGTIKTIVNSLFNLSCLALRKAITMGSKGVIPRLEKTLDDLRWETFFKYYFYGHTEDVDELLCEDLDLSSDDVKTWVENHPPAAIDIAKYKEDYEALPLEIKNALPRKKLQEVGFLPRNVAMKSAGGKNQTPKKTPPPKPAPTPSRTASKTPPAKPTPAKPTPAKPTPAKPTPAKPTPAKQTPTKSTPTKTTPAKKTPAKTTPAKTTPSKATPTKKPEKRAAGSDPKVTPKKPKPKPELRVLLKRQVVDPTNVEGYYKVLNRQKPGYKIYKQKEGKKKRYRPGTLALKEIRHYQATTGPLLAYAPMRRLCKELVQKVQVDRSNKIRWDQLKAGAALPAKANITVHNVSKAAVQALIEAGEVYLTNVLHDGYMCAIHSKRFTLQKKDIDLARRIRGDTDRFQRFLTDEEKEEEKAKRKAALAELEAKRAARLQAKQ